MRPILELRNLVKHYPGQRAVNGVSLSVPRGAFYSLIGPSGCGKTTTLRLIAGFEEPTSGQVLLDGEAVEGRKPYERNVSTVFQSYALFPHLNARDNIAFGLERRRAAGIAERVARMIAMVRLEGKETRLPAQLSGGERQRVALARSLVLEPDVLLLDEPLAALDPKLRKQVRLELKEMQRRTGITFLLVTHDQEEALSMSDRVAVMNQGLIEQVGTPEEVYLQPLTPFVAGFTGAVNFINGAGVRPEALRVSRTAEGAGRSVAATVKTSVFLGDCVQVVAQLSGGEEAIAQLARGGGVYQPGESVHLCWNPADEMLFS